MAKMMSKDSQIILNMLRIQDCMSAILDKNDGENSLTKDSSSIDLLTFYIVKLFALRKNFSGKTKKALTIFNDFKGNMVLSSLNYCYPMVSPAEIIAFAYQLSDEVARHELTERYEVCIKESEKYGE